MMASNQNYKHSHLIGFTFNDKVGKVWKIGNSLGRGNCGEVYLASENITKEVPQDSPYVIKVADEFNGINIITESEFYSSFWDSNFTTGNKFGIPKWYGSGSFRVGNMEFKYIILERLSRSLQNYFEENSFSYSFVCEFCIQILSIFEIVHKLGFVHRDLKAENILLDDKNSLYLIDFGISEKYLCGTGNLHVEYEENKFLAHVGTSRYTSRDSHHGVISRRSDVEMLAFNIIKWTGGILPWIHLVSGDGAQITKENMNKIKEIKIDMMDNLSQFLNTCYVKETPPAIMNFISTVAGLEFQERPNYDELRNILKIGIEEMKILDNKRQV